MTRVVVVNRTDSDHVTGVVYAGLCTWVSGVQRITISHSGIAFVAAGIEAEKQPALEDLVVSWMPQVRGIRHMGSGDEEVGAADVSSPDVAPALAPHCFHYVRGL